MKPYGRARPWRNDKQTLKDPTSAPSCSNSSGHWFRFAYGREASEADKCTVETLNGAFEKSKGDFREMVLALTQTDAFMFRSSGGSQ